MKVKANRLYRFNRAGWDLVMSTATTQELPEGAIVRVVNLPGCPPAGTMGHCHVKVGGEFAGMVACASLSEITAEERKAYDKALRAKPATFRPIREIARDIARDWAHAINYAARPYLSAMRSLETVRDEFGSDDGKSICLYFLGNAASYRGDRATILTAELRAAIGE